MTVAPAVNAPCSVLTAEQYRFMRLHTRHYDPPMKWRWVLGTNALRAYTESGHTATIGADGLERLIQWGLMARGPGCADMTITEAGREAVK